MQTTIIATVSLLTVLTMLGVEPDDAAPDPADTATPIIADVQRPSDLRPPPEVRDERSRRAYNELKVALERPELDGGLQFVTDIERLNHQRAARQGVSVVPAKELNYPHAPDRLRKLTLREALEDLEATPNCRRPLRRK